MCFTNHAGRRQEGVKVWSGAGRLLKPLWPALTLPLLSPPPPEIFPLLLVTTGHIGIAKLNSAGWADFQGTNSVRPCRFV
jgi:hypothetical protein